MSKSMVVTLPMVLLLLDYWPLGRWPVRRPGAERGITDHGSRITPHASWIPLVREKLPFFAAALVLGVVTIYSERAVGAISSVGHYPLGRRVANAAVSSVAYLGQTVWPRDLAVLYPYPAGIPWWTVAGSGLVLAVVTALVLRGSGRRGYLATGWGWYVITLLPVIGLVQIGSFARADRYTYVPLVGIFLLVSWGLGELGQRLARPGRWFAAGGAAILAVCAALTHRQLGFWRDGASLFEHALAVTGDNSMARNNYSAALLTQGRLEEALTQTREAARLSPAEAGPRINQGLILLRLGRVDEAIGEFSAAVKLDPTEPAAHRGAGDALATRGRFEEAVAAYREALRLGPGDAVTHHSLGVALGMSDRPEEALPQFEQAVRLDPGYAEAQGNLGMTLAKLGRVSEGMARLQEAVRLDPNLAPARRHLGLALAGQGRLDEAAAQFEAVVRLRPEDAEAHCDLGVVRGRQGRLDEAVAEFRTALKLKPDYADAQRNLQLASEQRSATPAGAR